MAAASAATPPRAASCRTSRAPCCARARVRASASRARRQVCACTPQARPSPIPPATGSSSWLQLAPEEFYDQAPGSPSCPWVSAFRPRRGRQQHPPAARMRARLARAPVCGHAAAGAHPGSWQLRSALAYRRHGVRRHDGNRRALARAAGLRRPPAPSGAAPTPPGATMRGSRQIPGSTPSCSRGCDARSGACCEGCLILRVRHLVQRPAPEGWGPRDPDRVGPQARRGRHPD